MIRYCVLVADGARARLFAAALPANGAVRLEERDVLLNPERNLSRREEFSSQAGRNRAPPRGAAHGYDDHRLRHRDEAERRFAQRVAATVGRVIQRDKPSWFVVVAEPRFLGMLRAPLDAELPQRLARTEVSADLSWHALPNIRTELERRGVLPESEPSPASWRARGQAPPKRLPCIEPLRARTAPR
jgi:protein required for attachment to host cells